jgi:hypothetical protein
LGLATAVPIGAAPEPASGPTRQAGSSFHRVVESQDGHLAEIQFMIGAQDTFVVHNHDESFNQGYSSGPARFAIRPSNHEISAVAAKRAHWGTQDQCSVRANFGTQEDCR